MSERPQSFAETAIATWIGVLSRGGILRGELEEAGVAVAAYLVGEGRLSALREQLLTLSPDEVEREQVAALQVCIGAAHADREVATSELELLRDMVRRTDLKPAAVKSLLAQVDAPPDVEAAAKLIRQPALQELLLALVWELAVADGRIDPRERAFYDRLAAFFQVDEPRAKEIRQAIGGELG